MSDTLPEGIKADIKRNTTLSACTFLGVIAYRVAVLHECENNIADYTEATSSVLGTWMDSELDKTKEQVNALGLDEEDAKELYDIAQSIISDTRDRFLAQLTKGIDE